MAKMKGKKSPDKNATLRNVSTETAGKGEAAIRAKKTSGPSSADGKPLCIVGIGTSGGGLEAVQMFLTHMPPENGIAFIVVPHLDPTHASIMADLLTRHTTMQVFQAGDGMKVRQNCVYVIPPGKDMAIMNGDIHLLEPQVIRGMRHPIDFFFRSLAKDQGERAVCIVLSGAGTDGTLGIKDIKGEGGMVMVQEPESAKYDGMPKSAIDTGLADYILPPEKMPEQLLKYVRHPYAIATAKHGILRGNISESLYNILLLIKNQTGRDFSYYKETTIIRRVERRMNVNQLSEVTHYVSYLQRNPVEIELLFKEILIGVTNFFRDPRAFDALKKKIVPQIFAKKPLAGNIRVWVPGCSTGEEAYSLAMILKEQMEKMKNGFNVQIFATDIDTSAIEKARTGVYPDSIVNDVPADCLKRFFEKGDNIYRIKKNIREMVVFAVHDLIKDPPFTKLDLIGCRNLLIYLNTQIQKKLISIFHFALNPDGILFLGTSESAGEAGDLFATIEKRWKIFKRKKKPLMRLDKEFPVMPPLKGITEAQRTGVVIGRKAEEPVIMDQVAKRLLLDDYTPPCVIINEKYNILYIHGKTGKYLEPAPGEARMNVLEMAREGLEYQLGKAIRKAAAQKKPVVNEGVQVKHDSSVSYVDIEVMPVTRPEQLKGLFLVVFKEVPSPAHRERAASAVKKGEERRVEELEKELVSAKEYLQHTIEEQQSSNEELQSMNEELQASNEELQSTNEELETSKEEVQSMNEELVTVNAELQSKIEELSRANDDLKNLLSSTDIAVIFLDNNLSVKRFTPSAAKLVNLIQSDIGRPIEQITSVLEEENLVEAVREVLKTLASKRKEVRTKKGDIWYLMRIMPYRTTDNVIDGVVITFNDISEQKRLLELAKESEEKYRLIFRDARDGIVVIDAEKGRIVDCNPEFERQIGRKIEELKRKNIWELSLPGKVEAARRRFLRIREKGSGAFGDLEFQRPDGEGLPVEFEGKVITIRGRKFIHGITHSRLAEKEKK